MEYCEGGSLEAIHKRIKSRQGRIGEKILGKVAEAVLAGLTYLHTRKIIHRDIKPSNIVLTRDGQIKLCDLGVSGELIGSLAGTFMGTSAYMAVGVFFHLSTSLSLSIIPSSLIFNLLTFCFTA